MSSPTIFTIIFVWGEYITYLTEVSTWVKLFIVYQKLLISKKFKFWWVHNNTARVWLFYLQKSKLILAVKEEFQVNGQIAVKREKNLIVDAPLSG